MKTKNQQHFSSEADAKEKLIVYVYEYLIHSGAKQAAETFKENIGYTKEIKVNEGPGFLSDWWCVFWDLYCAAPERRFSQPESSNDARAFHDFMRQPTPISPSVTQRSPQQQQQQHLPPPQFMSGPRYGAGPQPRGPPPRMQGGPPPGPPQMQPPPPGPSPQHMQPPPPGSHHGGHPSGYIPVGSPRYAQHLNGPPPPPPPGPPQQQQHSQGPPPPHTHPGQQQHQGMMGYGPGPNEIDQMGQSPGLNRMTPVSGPPPPGSIQQVGGPPSVGGGPPQSPMIGISQQQQQHMVNTPPQSQDEYVMPGPFGQETNDQFESAEILKLKQSMQEDTTKMFEKEQSEFNLGDYSDVGQNKWS